MDARTKRDVAEGLWHPVMNRVSKMSEHRRALVVKKAIKYCTTSYYLSGILPHCTDQQLDAVLTEAVTRRLWGCVVKLLGRAATNASVKRKGFWNRVMKLFRGGPLFATEYALHDELPNKERNTPSPLLSTRNKNWALEEASKHVSDECLLGNLLSHCEDDQIETLLKTIVERKMWTIVDHLLDRKITTNQGKWVFEERAVEDATEDAIKHASDKEMSSFLRHYLSEPASSNPELPQWARGLLCTGALRPSWAQRHFSHVAQGSIFAPFYMSVKFLVHSLRFSRLCTVVSLLQHLADEKQIQSALKRAVALLTEAEKNAVVEEAVNSNTWTLVSLLCQAFEISTHMRHTVLIKLVDDTFDPSVDRENVGYLYHCLIQHCDSAQLMRLLESAIRQEHTCTPLDIVTRIGQAGDSLVVSEDGLTILHVVTVARYCRRQLVVECIKMGISTHQLLLADRFRQNHEPTSRRPMDYWENNRGRRYYRDRHIPVREPTQLCSPLLQAVEWRDLPLVQLLYESGSCSSHDLHSAQMWVWRNRELLQNSFTDIENYLKQVTSTPRSLKSACRLVISHNLGVGYGRQERVKELRLPDSLRDYVLFSDLVNTDSHDPAQTGPTLQSVTTTAMSGRRHVSLHAQLERDHWVLQPQEADRLETEYRRPQCRCRSGDHHH